MELFRIRTAWKLIAFLMDKVKMSNFTVNRPHLNIDSGEFVLCQSIDLTFYLLGGNLFFSNIKDWQSFSQSASSYLAWSMISVREAEA